MSARSWSRRLLDFVSGLFRRKRPAAERIEGYQEQAEQGWQDGQARSAQAPTLRSPRQ